MNERLQRIREMTGLSLRSFAARLGMSGGSISLLENGKRQLTSAFINAVCKEFKVNENWLRTGEGEMLMPQSRADRLAEVTAALYNDDDDGFRLRLIELIAGMSAEQIQQLQEVCKKLTED